MHQINMKTTFKITLLLISLTFMVPAKAQEPKLNQIKAHLETDKGLKIDYELTVNGTSSRGTYYALGDKFYLESEEIKSWHDGKDLWVYMPQNGEVNLSSPYPEDLRELNPLLNLDVVNNKEFELKEFKSGTRTTLRATPRKATKGQITEWLEVTVDTQNKPLLLKVKERGMQEVVTLKVLSLQKMITPEMQKNAFFSFSQNKVPGAAVIDLR